MSNLPLTIPVVGGTVDPTWANEINGDLTIIAAHNHASGSGNQVPSEGINIDSDLSHNGFNITALNAARFLINSASLAGSNDKNEIYDINGDLYWNNGAGVAVRITNGSNVSISGSTGTFGGFLVSSNLTLSATSPYNVLFVNTTGNRQITLPQVSTVSEGKTWWVFDVSGQANNHPIEFIPHGTDTIIGNNQPLWVSQSYGAWQLTNDGSAGWWMMFSQQDVVNNNVAFKAGVQVGFPDPTGKNFIAAGDLHVAGAGWFGSSGSFGGSLNVGAGLLVGADATVAGSLTVSSNATIDGTELVVGNATFFGSEDSHAGNLSVGKNLWVKGTGGAGGSSADLNVSGSAKVAGTTELDGMVTLGSAGGLTIDAGANVSGFIQAGTTVVETAAVVQVEAGGQLTISAGGIGNFFLDTSSELETTANCATYLNIGGAASGFIDVKSGASVTLENGSTFTNSISNAAQSTIVVFPNFNANKNRNLNTSFTSGSVITCGGAGSGIAGNNTYLAGTTGYAQPWASYNTYYGFGNRTGLGILDNCGTTVGLNARSTAVTLFPEWICKLNVHNGATLATATIYFNIYTPAGMVWGNIGDGTWVYPKVNIYRYNVLTGATTALNSSNLPIQPSPSSGVGSGAAFAALTSMALTFDGNSVNANVIDTTVYEYYLYLSDNSGTAGGGQAAQQGNQFLGIRCNFSSIASSIWSW